MVIKKSRLVWVVVLAALFNWACPAGPNVEESGPPRFIIEVEVQGGLGGQAGYPLTDAAVSLRLAGAEGTLAQGTPKDSWWGWYTVQHSFEDEEGAPDELILAVEASGHTPKFVRVPPITSGRRERPLIIRVTLYPTEHFEVANLFRLSMIDQRVSVTLPPEDVASGRVRLFEPDTDAAGMPGALLDGRGRHLGVGVFSSVTLDDGAGGLVSEAGDSTVLRMKLPRSSWGSLVAIEPGDTFIEPGDTFIEPGDTFIEPGDTFFPNGDIQLPIYGFEPSAGSWSFAGVGWLESSPGVRVSMESLGTIWNETFDGSLFVAAPVEHFSYWGLAWPEAGEACLSGRLLDTNGQPGAGVTISARGVGRPIAVSPVMTDGDGRFCLGLPPISAMRPYRLHLEALFGKLDLQTGTTTPYFFDLGEMDLTGASALGTCGGDGCLEMEWTVNLPRETNPVWAIDPTGNSAGVDEAYDGDPTDGGVAGSLDPESLCSLMVLVQFELKDENGNLSLVAGSPSVSARLPFASRETVEGCMKDCVLEGSGGEDGRFQLIVPKDEVIEITAKLESGAAGDLTVRTGTTRVDGCPIDAVIQPGLTQGVRDVTLSIDAEALDGFGPINWSTGIGATGEPQSLPADYIEVRSASGELKWAIAAEGLARFSGRVIYGQPGEAIQLHPRGADGPAPLQPGDVATVHGSDLEDGILVNGLGTGVVN